MGSACPVGATPQTTIQAAIAAANNPANTYMIRVGSGAYTDGPYVLPAGVSLRGSGAGTGAGATKLGPATGAQTYVTVNGGTVADLRVELAAGSGATGIAASNNAIVDNVVVFGPGGINANGLQFDSSTARDVTVNVTAGSGNIAVKVTGGTNTLSDSTWNGGATGYLQAAGTSTVQRVTVQQATTAVSVEGGTLNIEDSVLDLGTSGTAGLRARPPASGTASVPTANHLTVVGGAAGSTGVVADATEAGATATVSLSNSIVRGPTTSLVNDAGSVTVSRSNYQTTQGTVTNGGSNLVGVDPSFINPAGDYHLRATSPLVDKGAVTGASLDRDRKGRSFDGDKNGVPVPDMGAYELRDVTAPQTTFTSGQSGAINDNTPVFAFRSEAGAKFECQVDAGAWQSCASPTTTTPLADGVHSFSVRATDEVFNVETTPAVRSFTVDTAVPNATITKKPPKRFFKKRVKFKFATDEPGATFQCLLDNRAWQKCQPTFRFNVKVGKHRLLVRAVDAAGNVDPTPQRYRYKRVQRRR